MSRTVALTGGTGFIGTVLVRRLADAGWHLRVLVRPKSNRACQPGMSVRWIEGDLEDPESLGRLVCDAEAVVHCAGAVRGASQADFNRINADGVARIVRAAVLKRPFPRFVLISSLAAREPQLSPYAASKRLGEKVLAESAGVMPWTALRPPAVYGPGDRELLPLFQWMARGIAPVLGSAGARFSLLFVDDLARAVLCLLNSKTHERRVFELHDGHPGGYTWDDVADTAARLRGKPVIRVRMPWLILRAASTLNLMAARGLGYAPMFTPGKIRELRHSDWVCDNTSFSDETGWVPAVSLEQGLRYTLNRSRAK